MKKRVISVFVVLLLCFSFPIASSAAYDPFDFLVEHFELTFEQLSSIFGDGQHGPSVPILKSHSSHRSNYDKSSSSGDFVNAQTYTFPGYNGDVTFSRDYIIQQIYNNDHVDVSGYKWFCIYINDSAGDYIRCVFFPPNSTAKLHMLKSDFENYTFSSSSYISDFDPVSYFYCYGKGFYFWYYSLSQPEFVDKLELSQFRGGGAHNPNYILYNDLSSEFIDGDDSSLYHWESQIIQTGNDVRTTIACILDDPDSRDKVDLSGYSCGSGIVYHDSENDLDGYPSADYFFFDNISTAHYPEPNVIFKQTYNFNLKDFEQFRKRKRLDSLDNFYIYTNVIDDNYECVHYRQQLIDWGVVDDGIFADTEDIPSYQIPTLIDLPSILPYGFDYSPTTYTTINNYNGTDFDFESFFGWFEGSFVAMANNMSAFFANAQNFMAAFADFEVNGTLNAIANIGSLIDDLNLNLNAHFNNIGDYINNISNAFDTNLKILFDNINNEFNGSIGTVGKLTDAINFNFDQIINSLTDYFGDLISTINNNTETITDNIHDQVVPDYDNIKFILQYYTGWFYQVYNVFDNVSVTPAPISVHLPFVNRDLDLVVPPSFQNLRDLITSFLYAATAFTCFRIGFQIFGIHLPDDSGGD